MQRTSVQKQKKLKIRGGFYMFKKMKHMKNEKGLTLIELLAVIVILAIVAAIAIPAIGNIINNQRDKAILSDVSGFVSSAKIAFADGSCGDDDKCNITEVEFKSEKIGTVAADNIVDFTDSDLPTIKVTLSDKLKAGGKTEKALSGLYVPSTGVLSLTESQLNEVMEGNAPGGTIPTPPTP